MVVGSLIQHRIKRLVNFAVRRDDRNNMNTILITKRNNLTYSYQLVTIVGGDSRLTNLSAKVAKQLIAGGMGYGS